MAKNLTAKGHPLAITAFRKRERVADLLSRRRQGVVQSSGDGARVRRGVFVRHRLAAGRGQVVSGPEGLLAGASQGLVIVDCSTSEPDSTTRMRELCAAKGVSFIDAPLARTPVEAEAGKLNVMVGASAEDFAQHRAAAEVSLPRTSSMSAGPVPATIKLLNNFIAQAVCNATAEAFAVATSAPAST